MTNVNMKKIHLALFVLLCAGIGSYAQNTAWTTNGDIGIGTTTPLSLLHVNGNIFAKEYTIYNNHDNVVQTIENGVIQHLVGTYAGWDTKAVYIAGYNAGNYPAVASTERVFIGNNVNSNNYMFVNLLNGNVGVNTASPTSKLHVQGATLGDNLGDNAPWLTLTGGCGSGGNNSFLNIYNYRSSAGNNWLSASTRMQQAIDGSPMGFIEFNSPNLRNGMSFGTNNQYRMYINTDGQVGIGTAGINDLTYKLYVETGIRTRKIKVDQGTWADYVFDKNYVLPPLSEVENFIKIYQHLPDVLSAAEVAKKGIDLGDNQAVLPKKIEELGKYIIEQQKEIDRLRYDHTEIKELRQQVDELKKTIKGIEK